MAYWQQENNNHVTWYARAKLPVTSQDDVISFCEKWG